MELLEVTPPTFRELLQAIVEEKIKNTHNSELYKIVKKELMNCCEMNARNMNCFVDVKDLIPYIIHNENFKTHTYDKNFSILVFNVVKLICIELNLDFDGCLISWKEI